MSNPAIQDAVWSGSIQHGGFAIVLEDAASSDKYFKYRTAEEQLRMLYAARSSYTDKRPVVPYKAGRGRYEKELPAILARERAYQEARRR